MENKIIHGDCLEELKKLEDNSVDAIITDPPYGLEFMGKKWDYDVPSIDIWKECLRVLKHGGHLLSFSGTRTYHRMVINIEDAGFEIRDCIMWLYGSGFPKCLNIGKQIDKIGAKDVSWFGKWLREWREKNNITQKEIARLFPSKTGGLTGCVANWELGLNIPTPEQFSKIVTEFNLPFETIEEAEREVIGKGKAKFLEKNNVFELNNDGYGDYNLTAPTTQEAKEWEGWGTALKPACEPIVVARKPLSEKNVALNVLKHGTGGINIDACRIAGNIPTRRADTEKFIPTTDHKWGSITKRTEFKNTQGRFPANVILDEEAGKMLDEQAPKTGAFAKVNSGQKEGGGEIYHKFKTGGDDGKTFYEDGLKGASRFFYCAKASKSERNKGTDSFINIEVFNMRCEDKQNERSLIQGERLVKLSVDMATLQVRDIEESGTQKKEDSEWNTMLFGKNLMEKYQTDFQSIIEMKTNSTILLKTWSWLTHLLTKEYTLDVNSLMENGGSRVENAEKSKELIITINEKLASALGVKNVVSGMQLKIRLSEGKCDHPTVKPIKLMEYLIKLITREGQVILEPFLGSGTTAIACVKLNRNFIGIEKEEEYIKIAKARIKPFLEQKKLVI